MKIIFIFAASLFTTIAYPCIDVGYKDLICTEKLDNSNNFYPLDNITYSADQFLIKQSYGDVVIPIPSTQKDPSDWSTSYRCKGDHLILTDEYKGVISSQILTFYKNYFSYEGTTLIQSSDCDSNDNCKSTGVRAVKIVGTCE